MASHSSATITPFLLLLLTFCFFFSSPASAFNITRILDHNPDFAIFNSYLSQTELAAEINRRQTITVLAVDNSSISSALSGQPLETIRDILSVHVILDYYGIPKIRQMKRRSTLLTTLFQSSGLAADQMGFVNLTKTLSGIRLGSAEPGAGLTVDLIRTVASMPYNISVLQVSGVIVPPGIGYLGNKAVTPPPPPPAAPAPEKAASAPAPEAESPDAVSPPAPSPPADAPEADVPAPASAPAPTSDDATPAKAPAADQEGGAPIPSADKSTSSATREAGLGAGVAAAVVGAAAVALLAAL